MLFYVFQARLLLLAVLQDHTILFFVVRDWSPPLAPSIEETLLAIKNIKFVYNVISNVINKIIDASL